MSENIEFISAADLPTTEAEEVDVLCVENGELKRKAGATLGGGGGSFRVVLTTDNTIDVEGMPVCTDNFDELAKALEANRDVFIILTSGLTGGPVVSMRVISWMCVEGNAILCAVFQSMYDVQENMLIAFTNGSYIPQIG